MHTRWICRVEPDVHLCKGTLTYCMLCACNEQDDSSRRKGTLYRAAAMLRMSAFENSA